MQSTNAVYIHELERIYNELKQGQATKDQLDKVKETINYFKSF